MYIVYQTISIVSVSRTQVDGCRESETKLCQVKWVSSRSQKEALQHQIYRVGGLRHSHSWKRWGWECGCRMEVKKKWVKWIRYDTMMQYEFEDCHDFGIVRTRCMSQLSDAFPSFPSLFPSVSLGSPTTFATKNAFTLRPLSRSRQKTGLSVPELSSKTFMNVHQGPAKCFLQQKWTRFTKLSIRYCIEFTISLKHTCID